MQLSRGCERAPRGRLASALLAAAVIVGAATPAHAQLTLRGNYWRDRNTRVVAPEADLVKELPSGTTISAGYLLDAITSASVSAGVMSDQPFTELRNQVALGVSQRLFRNYSVGASYRYSTESDYWAHVLGVSAGAELFQKNLILGGGFYYTHADVAARSGPTSFTPVGRLESKLLMLTASQVLTRSLVVEGAAELADEGGSDAIDTVRCALPEHKSERECLPEFLSNPYRNVLVGGSPMRESDPGERKRLSLTGVARYSLLLPGLVHYVVLAGKYRYYIDDWGVRSHAPELRTYVGLGPVELRVTGRYYTQSAADFFRYNQARDVAFYLQPGTPGGETCYGGKLTTGMSGQPVCQGGRFVYPGDAKLSEFSSTFLELRAQIQLGFLDHAWLPLGHWLGDGLLSVSYGHYFNSRFAHVQFGDAEVGGVELVLPL